MTEEQFKALEGNIEHETEKFLFFVSSRKKLDFIEFLKGYHLEKYFKVKRGDGRMFMFILDIRNREDYGELRELLNDKQPAFIN